MTAEVSHEFVDASRDTRLPRHTVELQHAAVGIYDVHRAVDHPDRRLLIEQRLLSLQKFRAIHIIVVDDRDVLAKSQRQRFIHIAVMADVLFAPHVSDPRIVESGNHLRRRIRRAVVGHDHLEIGKCLLENGLQRFLEVPTPVKGRQTNGDAWTAVVSASRSRETCNRHQSIVSVRPVASV